MFGGFLNQAHIPHLASKQNHVYTCNTFCLGWPGGGAACVWWLYTIPLPSAPPAVEEVDNTVTLIILAVVGGVIGLLVCILLLKKLITFILKKTREKK